jgi:hypothetical protein
MLVVDDEDDEPGQKALPPRPRGHKATKADLAREASSLAFSQTLEKIMAKSQAALAKRGEKRRLEKEVSNAIYLNLSKEALRFNDWTLRPKRQTPRPKYVTPRAEDGR